MVKPLVSVVITTRNRNDDVIECLQSVFQSDYPNFEVIVVDNDSGDETVRMVTEKFPRVKLVKNKVNRGIVGGRNDGQKIARGKYILFLDSDTAIDKRMLSELAEFAEKNQDVGVAAPKMYPYSQRELIWYAGATINMLTSQTLNVGGWEVDRRQYDTAREASHAPTAFLARRDVSEQIGGHDETYFMSYGDADFGCKVKKAGYKVMYVPTAELWHKNTFEAGTLRSLGFEFPLRAYYYARNRFIFMKKNAPFLNFVVFFVVFTPIYTTWYSFKILQYRGGLKFLKPYLRGTWDGIKYAFGMKVKNIIP